MNGPALVMLTILMILLMTATAVLAIILANKKKTAVNRCIRNLSLFLLCYFLNAFLQYYLQYNQHQIGFIKATGILADVCYFLMIVSCVTIIQEFAENKNIVKRTPLFLSTAIYGVITESIVIFAGTYTRPGFDLIIENVVWKNALLALNAFYGIWILYLAIRYLFFAIKKLKQNSEKTGAILFSALLGCYMLWTLVSDYCYVYIPYRAMSHSIPIDPLLILYCMVTIAIIYFFFRKDPLSLFTEKESTTCNLLLPDFVAKYGLTKREAEVLELVCSGLNNSNIATKLYISEHTVKRHTNNIFHKTKVKNRYELISKVLKK